MKTKTEVTALTCLLCLGAFLLFARFCLPESVSLWVLVFLASLIIAFALIGFIVLIVREIKTEKALARVREAVGKLIEDFNKGSITKDELVSKVDEEASKEGFGTHIEIAEVGDGRTGAK